MNPSSLVSKVVNEALAASGDQDSEWSLARDEIVLELLSDWLSKGVTFEARTEDVGYDVSTRSKATGERPDIEKLDTLGVWLSQATGQDVPTFQSGSGMRAETWEERLIQNLEEWIDNFSVEALGDLLEEDDFDTLTETRIEIEGYSELAIGCVEIEVDGHCYQNGTGYLGRISMLSPQQFALSVSPSLLKNFPIFRQVYVKVGLEEIVAGLDRTGCPLEKNRQL